MKCRKCRGEIPDGSKFCMLCGADQNPAPRRKALKRANGTGTVYKLSGHRKRSWAAAKDGVIIGYYETKTAAMEAVNKLIGQDITEKYNMTFDELYADWKREHYKDYVIGHSAYSTTIEKYTHIPTEVFVDAVFK